MKNVMLAVALIGGGVGGIAETAVANTFVVSYEGEAARLQNTSATFTVGGVETFDSQTSWQPSFTTNFGTGGAGSAGISGTYAADSSNGVQINSADQYGGAGGTGKYAVAFNYSPYSLTLTSAAHVGINYFGYWLSALDAGNFVTFYGNGGQKLFTFDPSDVLAAVNASANPSQYYGNPNSAFAGQDGGEPFIFLNFFDTNGTFSKVSFSENGGGGYESDNHTVGHYLTMGHGTLIPLTGSVTAAVPELSTWAMMLLGFGGLGFAGYRRSRKDGAATLAA
jgi:hypothetical protein